MFNKRDKELTIYGKTKKDKESKLLELPKWFHSKNDFKEAIKLIQDIKADTNNVKSNSDKEVFKDLNELINNMKNNKNTKNSTINKIRNIVSDLDQLRKKESTVVQTKMYDVVYYLFNSLAISSKPGRLMLRKWVNIGEKRFNEILSTVTKAKNEGFRTNVGAREITLDNTESSLKGLRNELVDGHEFINRYNDIVNDVELIKLIELIVLLIKDTKTYKRSKENAKNFIPAKRDC